MKLKPTVLMMTALFAMSSCGDIGIPGLTGGGCDKKDFAKLTFSEIDKNGDSGITFDEFEAVYKLSPDFDKMDKTVIKKAFDKITTDNGTISNTEFLSFTEEDTVKYKFEFDGCDGKDLSPKN